METELSKTIYGRLADGREVELYTLRNRAGLTARVITRGATLTEMHTPDRDGNFADIALGYDTLDGWLRPSNPHMGCIAGRFANRIAGGRFTLDGVAYALPRNHGTNCLHGGPAGFDKALWSAEPLADRDGPAVRFTHTSPDGDAGFPGTLRVAVDYILTESDELRLVYSAATDKPTVLNLTNHAYWNLGAAGDVRDHVLQLHADDYTPVDGRSIPTGGLAPVAGTPMDFTAPTRIGDRIDAVGANPTGYDHNYVVRDGGGTEPAAAARVHDPASGRVLEVLTTEPGVQFYSGNYLDGSETGKAGRAYCKHAGLCLEAQHFPDSPNRPAFPSTVLRPGETYRQTTTHRFTIDA